MKRQEVHTRIHFYSSMLLAFSLPFSRMMQLFIIFLVLNWLIEGDLKQKFRAISGSTPALLFILFYVLHLTGMLYTENIDSGLFDIQMKLSLLFFPVIFASRPLKGKELRYILYSFMAGGVVTSLLLLLTAAITWFSKGENAFFYEAFSFLIHPSYLAMYLNFIIIWMLMGLLNKNERVLSPLLVFVVAGFFSLIIVLLSSKMGLITMLLTYVGFIAWFVISRKKYLFGLAGLTVIMISVYAVLHFVPEIRGRIDRAVEVIMNGEVDQTDAESTAVRLLVWKASNEVIKKHPLIGTGTGDAKDELMKEYSVEGMTGAMANRLNCHNEYYQVLVTLGIIGFLVFLLHLYVPLRNAIRKGAILYVLFLLLILLNFLPESMLETQAGVMFFAFFNSILCFSDTNETNIKNKL